MSKYQTIIYEKKDGVARITLNRPEAMIAINRTMFLEIGSALDDAVQDGSVRVVVMKGAGRAFCAGVDLKFATEELKTLQDQQDLKDLAAQAATCQEIGAECRAYKLVAIQ